MPFAMFHDLVPDIGMRETRSVNVLSDSEGGLPPDDYGLLEMYCNEKGCDCRRVYLSIFTRSTAKLDAHITWGWESPAFYRKSLSMPLTAKDIAQLTGPALAIGQPQSELAPGLLAMVRDLLANDEDYRERIKRHYAMVRAKVDGPPKTEWWRKRRRNP